MYAWLNVLRAVSRTGFCELPQSDQIRLIKQGSFEVAFIRYTKLFDEEGMMVPTMEHKIPTYVLSTHYEAQDTHVRNFGPL